MVRISSLLISVEAYAAGPGAQMHGYYLSSPPDNSDSMFRMLSTKTYDTLQRRQSFLAMVPELSRFSLFSAATRSQSPYFSGPKERHTPGMTDSASHVALFS